MLKTAIPELHTKRRGGGAGGRRKSLSDLGQGIYASVGRNTRYRQFQRTYRNDRVAFVYDCIPNLRETFALYQEEIISYFDVGERRVAVRAPHGGGKSAVAAILVHHFLLTSEEDALVPTLASVYRQLERYLWPEIHKMAKYIDWQKVGRDPYNRDELMTTSIRLHHDAGTSESFAVASGDAATIEGAHASRLFYIFDESKSVEEGMWDAAEGAFSTEGAVMLGTSGKRSGECLWLSISTPGIPLGRFYEIHARKEGYDDWVVRHISIEECIAAGRVRRDWVEQRKRQWGVNSPIYKNRVLAEFASTDSDSVIPLDWVEAAMDRWVEWDEQGRPGSALGLRRIGVDTARYGDDKTVFAERIDDAITDLHIYERQNVPVTAGMLKPMAQKAQETVIEMDSGLGAAVYDILMSEQDPWNPTLNLYQVYMGAGTARTDKTGLMRFNSTRSAAWWHMRELLDPESGKEIMLPPDDYLKGDLIAPGYELKYFHGDLCVFVEPKENLRKKDRLGRSTDRGDAVVLAFWDDAGGGGGVVF